MNLKQKITEALKNPDFPDLKFLYSREVLDIAEEVLEELLEDEKKDFSEKIGKKYKDLDSICHSEEGNDEAILKNNQIASLHLQGQQYEKITFETFQEFSLLDYFFGILEHYQGVNNDEKIREIIENFEPKYIDFGNEVAYSKRYYEMLKYCYENLSPPQSPSAEGEANLSEQGEFYEQMRILEKTIEAYEVRGIALEEKQQEKLKKINKELSELSQKFSNNVLDSQKLFEYIITDEKKISEMPNDDKEVARKRYEEKYNIKMADNLEKKRECYQFLKKIWKKEFKIDLDEEKFERFQKSDIFYVGEDTVIGCVEIVTIDDQIMKYDVELVGVANVGEKNLGRIGVLEEYRGEKMGSHMMEYVQNFYAAKGEKRMFLSAAIQNEEYYKSFGFRRFSDPVDCGNTKKIMMQVPLQPSSPPKERRFRGEGVVNKKGDHFLFDASQGSYISIMKYCNDSKVRKDFYEARNKYGSEGGFNNRPIILKLLKLREQKAKLLGFQNYGELSLKFKMADSPEQVVELFSDIAEKAKPKAQEELHEIKEYFGLSELNVWDVSYYARKLKEEKYALDDRELKKYFVYENVLKGMFEVMNRLYGIKMIKTNIESYHEEVEVYEVYRDGKFLSYFFTDYFYRPLKRQGAWANIMRENSPQPSPRDGVASSLLAGENGERCGVKSGSFKKITLNVCNFQKGSDGVTLLTLSDVETMFHEFGHATHEMLSKSVYSELSGFHVEWDFVELPSQLLENWCRDRAGMKLFAKHFESGEDIPEAMLEKLEALEAFGNGQFILKQNEYAMMDMGLHMENIPKTQKELDEKIYNNYDLNALFPRGDIYAPHTSFSHIFDGGYAAGYYSYMWAEIIEKEVWKAFKDSGDIFSAEIAKKFHNLMLSAGTTKKASELFRDFFGRDIEIDAFLSEKGLK